MIEAIKNIIANMADWKSSFVITGNKETLSLLRTSIKEDAEKSGFENKSFDPNTVDYYQWGTGMNFELVETNEPIFSIKKKD